TFQQIGGNWNPYASDYHFRLVTGPVEEFTCDEPAVLVEDDLEALALGEASGQTEWWAPWPGGTVGAQVTDEQALNGAQSIKIAGDIAGQDALLLLGDQTDGNYVLRWDMYIPSGNNAYLNMQHAEATGNWAFHIHFENNAAAGTGFVNTYEDPILFEYPEDLWFPVFLFIDIDNDVARLTIDEHYVGTWAFSTGSTTGNPPGDDPSNVLGAINFYPIDASYVYYVDNVNYWRTARPAAGQYCITATNVGPGSHTVSDLNCFGGGFELRIGSGNNINGGLASAWYSYTPSSDGTITVSSCGGDEDTRVWIFSGDCDNLAIVGVNDDRCDQSNGDPYASYKEAYVEAGNTYYIMWDDVWGRTDFKWDLEFSTDTPAEAAFCQSAQAVQPGEIDVAGFVGEAAVAGDDIYDINANSGTTPGPYAGSNWYSWTPEGDGVATISSCDDGSDTYVFVYAGTCGDYNSLELIASSDSDCGVSSLIEGWEVTGGVTYYIEWIDERSADPFTWLLDFVSSVDETALKQGVKVFPNPASELLYVNIDLPEAADNLTVRLVNTFGQVVSDRYYGALQTGNIEINVSNIPAGMYLVQVTDGQAQYTQSVIIE
ncbi:MAG: T9SS type A sorting domain-containing protein, partial [Phaeodactylibacter sp.]|nr:T9SS type A sorting domain-containing protein [Phaeodactylibacter sp.]